MNWLCHALLVRPEPPVQCGAILADVLRGPDRVGLPAAMLDGMAHHAAVDRFTDAHPAFLRSTARVPSPYRRYAGVLVDVFYGRLLAAHWPEAEHGPLAAWLTRLHAGAERVAESMAEWPRGFLRRLVTDGWVADYAQADGHARVLGRLGRRLEHRFNRAVPLGEAAGLLEQQYDAFLADFSEFHPALVAALDESRTR